MGNTTALTLRVAPGAPAHVLDIVRAIGESVERSAECGSDKSWVLLTIPYDKKRHRRADFTRIAGRSSPRGRIVNCDAQHPHTTRLVVSFGALDVLAWLVAQGLVEMVDRGALQ